VAPAQEAPVSTPAPASAAAPALPPLTLEECIALSVKKNFNLVIADYAVVMARESLIVARANFDPTLGASSSRAVSQSASTTSKLDGTTNVGPRSDTTINQLSVSQNIPQTNGTITVTTNLNRTATNSSFSTLNPAFGDQITVTASQPLLKNFGSTVARAPINNAKLNVELADLAYKISILQTVQQTEAAYYGLVYARENLRVLQHSLDLAQKLYDENLAKKNVGTATDLDVFTAEVGVQQARNNVVQAIQTVQNNEDSLLNTIGPSDFTIPVGEVSFTTIADEKFTPSFDHSYKLALDNSPNYLTQLATIEQLKITVDTTKQNRLPSLNLTGALGYNSTDATYGDVVAALPNHHGNNWSLGLVYSMPWGMRAANAQYRTAIENLNQQKTQLSQYEQSLVVSVRSAVRAVDTNAISVQISSQATQLSMKNYDLTNAQFAAGLATSRQVLQAQQDLEGVRVQELQARVNLLNAISNLRALDATSLEKYQIDLSKGRLGPVVP
jgi:outer membrane protein TolC